jgi:hypothetical protein
MEEERQKKERAKIDFLSAKARSLVEKKKRET